MADVPNLLNLENKLRQQPKIAHEIGAGSQCTRCGPKCAGFDLHFWRKVCRNCRCGKEHHAVKDGEDPGNRVGRLLDDPMVIEYTLRHSKAFSDDGDEDTKASRGQREGQQRAQREQQEPEEQQQMPREQQQFNWTPSTDGSDLAARYVQHKQMPTDERKRALDRQLPVHDLDPEQCQSLSAPEKRRLEEYVKNVKQNAVGRGTIQECPPRYVTVTPAIGGVSKSESVKKTGIKKLAAPPPQLDRILEHKINQLSLNRNRTSQNAPRIANFITAKPFQAPRASPPPPMEEERDEEFPPPPPEFVNLPPPPPELLQEEAEQETDLEAEVLHREMRSFMDFLEDKEHGKRATTPARVKSPFITSASQFNSSPKPYGSPSAPPGSSGSSGSSSPRMQRFGSQSPQTRRLLLTDIDMIPESAKNNNHAHHTALNNNEFPVIPRTNFQHSHPHSISTGPPPAPPAPVVLQQQLDQHPHHLHHHPQEVQQQQHEVPVQVEKIWLCQNCTEPIRGGEVAIFAERAGSDKCWHPHCFSCSICHEILAELVYFFVDDSIFCGRHYAEKVDIPRCKACDELIFAAEYTSADGANWHTNHFCCWLCDTPLAGHQYTPIEGQPHCLNCYQKKFGKDCYECSGAIRADQTRVSHGEMHWHADASCFRCHHCRSSMVNRQFLLKNDRIYCSRDCAVKEQAPVVKEQPPAVVQ